MDSRQSKQQLLREISDLLDVANIQDDLLQRMKSEPRLTGQRRDDVLTSLNGAILPIDELFNQYADQASYYDICILIYQVADHRNPADIKATWQNLIDQTDDQSQALYGRQALSWEVVGEKVRELGRRLNVNDATFPVLTLLPMLERYSIAGHDQRPPATWALDLFLDLDIPHETLLPVLEQMYYGNEQPFVGGKRKFLGGQMVYLIKSWYEQSERKGERVVFGSEENGSVVSDCLATLLRTGDLDGGARRDAEEVMSEVQRARR
jgi:nuclear pore complex protein Nup155